jgi:hypothetical protein
MNTGIIVMIDWMLVYSCVHTSQYIHLFYSRHVSCPIDCMPKQFTSLGAPEPEEPRAFALLMGETLEIAYNNVLR